LKPSDLRAFHKSVREVLLYLVNTQDVKCRMPNGTHILLYPPDGETRPFKVSASRRSDASLTFIEEQFVKPHHLEMP
jgi:hypothetical protein